MSKNIFLNSLGFNTEATTTGISANSKQHLFISIEAFKQWGMLSQTEKGKQLRLYFIECEK